jgi:dihydrofolate synthase/folylpolyglutamate synthase
VITDISLDHQKFLGNTVGEIAQEKAGIIRPGRPVVVLPQQPSANDVIGNTILELGARGISAVPYVPPVSPAAASHLGRLEKKQITAEGAETAWVSRYPVRVVGKEILIESPLLGRHQLRNIALAIATAEELKNQGFSITPETIEQGIRETRWPGRFQVVPAAKGSPELVLDVAHNPAGAWALRSTLSACYEDRQLTFVFGAMRDKAIGEMAEILFPLAERVIATRADNPRSATPEEVRDAATRVSTAMLLSPSVGSALAQARELAGQDGVVVITGSIYIVGEAMRQLGLRI